MAFTFFFRDVHTLEHAAEVLIPETTGRSRIRIWDAGCAMGPEPYTLAIILAERMGNFSFKNLYITASDIDESGQFGNIIDSGIYSKDELARIPEDILAKYFVKLEEPKDSFRIIDLIKNRVTYQKHDLLTLNPVGDGFSLVLCKNVLLHFQPAERIEVMKMFHKSLSSGGFLVTENTQKLPEELSKYFVQVVPDSQIFKKIEI